MGADEASTETAPKKRAPVRKAPGSKNGTAKAANGTGTNGTGDNGTAAAKSRARKAPATAKSPSRKSTAAPKAATPRRASAKSAPAVEEPDHVLQVVSAPPSNSSPAAQRLAAQQYAIRMANARKAMAEAAAEQAALEEAEDADAGTEHMSGADAAIAPLAAPRSRGSQVARRRWTPDDYTEAVAPPTAPAPPAPEAPPHYQPQAPHTPQPSWGEAPPAAPAGVAPAGGYGPPPYGPSQYGPPAYLPAPAKRSNGFIVALIIGALVLAGGGTGLFLATRNSKPSKSEFIKQADAICTPANAPTASVARATSYPELATSSGSVAAATNAQVAKLRGLALPGGADSVQAKTMISELGSAGQAAQQVSSAAVRSDDAATASATRDMGTAYNTANNAASAYGFTACAMGLKGGMDAVFGGAHTVVKANFVAKADTACRASADDLGNIPEPSRGSGPAVAAFLDSISAAHDRMMAQVRALPVAPGDESAVADILSAEDQAAAKAKEMADAARSENLQAFVADVRQLDTLGTAVAAKWDAYGLGSCGTHFGEG